MDEKRFKPLDSIYKRTLSGTKYRIELPVATFLRIREDEISKFGASTQIIGNLGFCG